jgi:putative addiction module component (TIGR02574 family)
MSDKISMADVLRLSVAERILLVEDIWDSIAINPESLEITEAQRSELDARLAEYRKDPSAGTDWEDLKRRMGR